MSSSTLDFRNVNSLWCSVLVETLVRGGLTHAVVSPGSRSTPLAFAFARHEGVEAIPALDERSAAFFALGLARQQHRPVAVICTSGTAAANFFPAVIEARESEAPLLILTADRPPELRECASGQTIDQQKLYGNYPRWQHELAVPEAVLPALAYVRQTALHALTRATGLQPGPVHLNLPFRDPLPPIADGIAEKLTTACDWDLFFRHAEPPAVTEVICAVPRFPMDVHGVIIAGPAQPGRADDYVAAVGAIAQRLGWPVLAEGLSPLRNHAAANPTLVTAYDSILRNPNAAERLRPEYVLCLGGWPISKVLRGWLQASDAPTWVVSEGERNLDALHLRARPLRISLRHLAALLPQATEPNGYQRLWASFERKARAALDSRLTSMTDVFEGRASWLLAQHLPAGTPFFVANSMPVRDVEYFWPPNDRHLAPVFNRGANGIDGTLSTALGLAHGGPPSVLLTGDLALLHDTNGFLSLPKFRGSLTIVLINNHGGGIFNHLPVAEFEPPFEEFFATPQEADFAKLCSAYGAEHVLIRDWEHFTSAVAALPASGVRVLELRTDRKLDAARRKQLFADVAAAL
jgi:2-succinyl-5-enolpyruvyl-6-hydroxy-3-cyclohexene-1-carboxylate synthase